MIFQNAFLNILTSKNRLVIKFGSPSDQSRIIKVGFVIDFDLNGNVLGIEIINLKYYAGGNVLEGIDPELFGSKAKVRISYDEDVDALYLSLSNGRSTDQITVDGRVVLDEKGHLVAIEADLT